jgi:hypothetical protein
MSLTPLPLRRNKLPAKCHSNVNSGKTQLDCLAINARFQGKNGHFHLKNEGLNALFRIGEEPYVSLVVRGIMSSSLFLMNYFACPTWHWGQSGANTALLIGFSTAYSDFYRN